MATTPKMDAQVIFKDRTRHAVAEAEEIVTANFVEFMDIAVEVAKEESPYATGNNRDLIDWDFTAELDMMIFTQSNYGAWLELGTSRMQPRPYMLPGIQAAQRDLETKKTPWSK